MKLTSLTTYLPAVIAIALFAPAEQTQAQTTVKTQQITTTQQVVTPKPETVIATPTTTRQGTPTNGVEYAYDRYMRLGYAASQRKDYPAALSYFTLALQQRPNDRYATLAYWNVTDYMKPDEAKVRRNSKASNYERFMQVGYAATEKKDYQTALINFQRALKQRPGDPYASQAMRNVQTYTNRGTGIAKR